MMERAREPYLLKQENNMYNKTHNVWNLKFLNSDQQSFDQWNLSTSLSTNQAITTCLSTIKLRFYLFGTILKHLQETKT